MQTENNTVASPTAAKAENGDVTKTDAINASQLANILKQAMEPKQEESEPSSEEQTSSESATTAEPIAEESQATQEAEGAEEQADVLSQLNLDNLDPKTRELVKRELEEQKKHIHEKVEKRIGKEVAKTKEAKEKLAQYEQQLAALNQQLEQLKTTPQTPVIDPIGEMPLAEINDLPSLQAKHEEAKIALAWAEQRLDEGVPDEGILTMVGDKQQVLTRAEIVTIKHKAKRVVEDAIPKRYAFLQNMAHASKQASELFPWISKKDSEEYKLAQAQLASAPWANKLHNRDVLIGFLVEGIQAVQKRQSAQAKTPAKKAPLDQATATAAPKTTPRVDSETLRKSEGHRHIQDLSKRGNIGQRELAAALSKAL